MTNLPKFSVKNDIQAQHYVKVKLNKFGDKKPNDFGADTYWGNCHVDGVEHMWFISENMHKGITEAGFGEGDTFCVMKWKQGSKVGYNYLPADDINIRNATAMNSPGHTPSEPVMNEVANKHTAPPPKSDQITKKDADWDKIAEGKTRCAVVCAYIQSGKEISQTDIDKIVTYIMTGK